jgi:hypothetical protein
MFIERTDDLPNQNLAGIIAGRLSDRHDLDAVLAQLPDRQFHLGDVAEEAIEGIEDDRVVRMIWRTSAVDHILQHRPAIVGRRLRFDELVHNQIVVLITKARRDFSLTRNRCFGS